MNNFVIDLIFHYAEGAALGAILFGVAVLIQRHLRRETDVWKMYKNGELYKTGSAEHMTFNASDCNPSEWYHFRVTSSRGFSVEVRLMFATDKQLGVVTLNDTGCYITGPNSEITIDLDPLHPILRCGPN